MFDKWHETRHDGRTHYEVQSEILKAALASGGRPLEVLLEGMRASGEACLYLSGTRLDNELCFGSRDLGLALSVLPENTPKAARPGYHPGSTEVYCALQGSLPIEVLQEGKVFSRVVEEHCVLVIPPGECHRVCCEAGRQSAALIVKTNPGGQPGVVRCSECGFYPDSKECALHRRWMEEAGFRKEAYGGSHPKGTG